MKKFLLNLKIELKDIFYVKLEYKLKNWNT